MSTTKKKFLIVNRKAPFGTSFARESLDAALAGAAFDQDISILFMDDGVFQLQKNQNGQEVGLKGVEASLPALGIYDITKVFTEAYSLNQRNLNVNDLLIETTALDDKETQALFEEHDVILSF